MSEYSYIEGRVNTITSSGESEYSYIERETGTATSKWRVNAVASKGRDKRREEGIQLH